jgi:hypothetical protein
MAKRKRNKPRRKPAKKRPAAISPLEPDTTEVVADIVHTLSERKFGARLAKKNNSKTDGNHN